MCPNCGKEPPPGATHCPFCGKAQGVPVPVSAIAVAQVSTFCVKCGASLTADSAFCMRCGAPSPGPGGALAQGRSTRALARSKREKMIGGVCGGIATYLRLNPLVLRLAFVIATFLSVGIALIVYVALWALLPADPAAS